MKIIGEDNSTIEGEESPDAVIGNRAEHLWWLYHVWHDPLIRIPELRSPHPPCSSGCYHHRTHPCERCGRIGGLPPTAQQPNTPRQPYEHDTDDETSNDT